MGETFKFIHAADLHLDSRIVAIKSFYGQKSICLAQEQQKAVIALVDLAIKEEVDFLVLSGDTFDSNWKDYSIGLFFIQQLKRLNCPVFAIRGNHDSENRLVKKLPYPKNFHLFDSKVPQTHVLETCKVALHGQSYAEYHISDDLGSQYPLAKKDYFNIGLLHTSGPKENGEQPYAPFNLPQILTKKYDYWALGHLHQNQVIYKSPPIVYSGIIQGRHIKESGAKGCYLVSVNEGKIEDQSFKILSNISWEKLYLDLTKIKNESELRVTLIRQLKSKIEVGENKHLIVRLIFKGNHHLSKPISNDLDYWLHTCHCWIEETFTETQVYLESIVDRSHYKNEGESGEIVNFLMDLFKNTRMKKELGQKLLSEYAALQQKIPNEIVNLDAQEGLNEDELIEQVHSYLESRFLETNRCES